MENCLSIAVIYYRVKLLYTSLSLLSGVRGVIGRRRARVFLHFAFHHPLLRPREDNWGRVKLYTTFFFFFFFISLAIGSDKSCVGRNIVEKEYMNKRKRNDADYQISSI